MNIATHISIRVTGQVRETQRQPDQCLLYNLGFLEGWFKFRWIAVMLAVEGLYTTLFGRCMVAQEPAVKKRKKL